MFAFSCCRYYIGNIGLEKDKYADAEKEFAFFLFELLSVDGIFTAQVGDAPTLRTATQGNPNIQDQFDFIDSLQNNGFVRIVNYEEVCISQQSFCGSWMYRN